MQMLKQFRFIFSSSAAIVLVFTGLSLPSPTLSQQSPRATTTASRSAALIAATQDVLKETSEIRQLSILRPVQSSAQSRADIERMIMKNLDQEMTPVQTHAIEVTLQKLGMAPPDFQYRALMIRLLTEQVAGYYDPKTREFHLADWIDLDGQKPVMAHELTHALQDQHFNLRRFEHWPKGDSDAEMAAHALIEGDATLAMALYVANNPLRALAFLKSLGTTGMSTVELDKAPRAVRESLLFPYQQGIEWTTSLYKQGGWGRVSMAFTELPQSTEQILHLEKYLAHEAPVKVILPDMTPLLNKSVVSGTGVPPVIGYAFAGSAGAPPALERYSSPITHHSSLLPTTSNTLNPPATWRRLDYDVQGEWGFYLILDQFLKSPAESRRAAAGWGGDRFAVYEGPKGETLFVSLSTWDTENDAREFFDAYVKRTELRYPGATPDNPSPQAGTRRNWRTGEGTVTIYLRGSRVLILEGTPYKFDVSSLQKLMG
jgi:hypothetical protein